MAEAEANNFEVTEEKQRPEWRSHCRKEDSLLISRAKSCIRHSSRMTPKI